MIGEKEGDKLKKYLLLVVIWFFTFQIFGLDYSTPNDGNLYIELSTPFNPSRTRIYSNSSVLERKNINFSNNRIYQYKDNNTVLTNQNMTQNSDVAWIDDKTYVILTGNDTSYPHGILGDTIESSGFEIYNNDQLVASHELTNGRVFETLRPLLADIIPDNIGLEIILTSSDRVEGSRVDVYSMNGELLTTSKPIGKGFRWLHILGVANFKDSETSYLVIVKTPHIGGRLELLYWDGTELKLETSLNNVSTHKLGSDNLNMAMIINVNEESDPEIIVPSMDYRRLLFIKYIQHELRVVKSFELPDRLNTNLFFNRSDYSSIWLGLQNGDLVEIYE